MIIAAFLRWYNLYLVEWIIDVKTQSAHCKSLPLQHRRHRVCVPREVYFSNSCSEKENRKKWWHWCVCVSALCSGLHVPLKMTVAPVSLSVSSRTFSWWGSLTAFGCLWIADETEERTVSAGLRICKCSQSHWHQKGQEFISGQSPTESEMWSVQL